MTFIRKVLICASDAEFLREYSACESPRTKYQVVGITGTEALIRKVYDEMPHLVIVDVHPSDVGAFDVCAQMKFDIILGHIPLVILTDSSISGAKIDCGADLYLHKPVNMQELHYHIDRIISKTIDELDINPLTHMPGNRSSVRTMESLIAQGRPFEISCLDLKNLGIYNDAYGVHRGDFLIRETAKIIKQVVADHAPAGTFIGHLGGDDFIVITEPGMSEPISEKIIETFDKSVHAFYERVDRERGYMVVKTKEGHHEHHSFVCLSIAIVTNQAIRYEHVAQITKTASQIHHYLKRYPSSTYLKDRRTDLRHPLSTLEVASVKAIRKPSDTEKLRNLNPKSLAMAAVAHVLKTGEVDTHFQKIVEMNGRTHGYEALSRFHASDGTGWDPAMVFRAAREANVIKEFDVVCARRALTNAQGLPPGEKLFINLNRETFMDPVCLKEILDQSPVPLNQLVIELTEQSLVTDTAGLLTSLEHVRMCGIEFAIDDMGGGSVSLRETANLRPDYIKFDGSLIRDIDKNDTKQKILLSLLVFAKSIQARTTAEGIETETEWRYLESTGIDFGQGYLIAKPAKIRFGARVE